MGQRPWATLLTVSVMALAVALPMGLWLVLQNVEQFSGSVTQSRDISVFLRPQVDRVRAQQLAPAIGQRAQVQKVTLRTPEQGLAEFRAMRDRQSVVRGKSGYVRVALGGGRSLKKKKI